MVRISELRALSGRNVILAYRLPRTPENAGVAGKIATGRITNVSPDGNFLFQPAFDIHYVGRAISTGIGRLCNTLYEFSPHSVADVRAA